MSKQLSSTQRGLTSTKGKDYLLGRDERLKEGLRAKLGLQPYHEGHCHRGIVHASKIGVFMESVRKILINLFLTSDCLTQLNPVWLHLAHLAPFSPV